MLLFLCGAVVESEGSKWQMKLVKPWTKLIQRQRAWGGGNWKNILVCLREPYDEKKLPAQGQSDYPANSSLMKPWTAVGVRVTIERFRQRKHVIRET
jgi:hypothetical protein